MQSDGGGEDAIKILDGAARNTVRDDTFDIMEIEPGIKRSRRHLILNGIDIFNFALKKLHLTLMSYFDLQILKKTKWIILFFIKQIN
ncbi:MAG: hypothetical protein IPL10_02195 [Bacteroidetes bacterium]|nr:hypothetical protein [Bacteroidota bacterium]